MVRSEWPTLTAVAAAHVSSSHLEPYWKRCASFVSAHTMTPQERAHLLHLSSSQIGSRAASVSFPLRSCLFPRTSSSAPCGARPRSCPSTSVTLMYHRRSSPRGKDKCKWLRTSSVAQLSRLTSPAPSTPPPRFPTVQEKRLWPAMVCTDTHMPRTLT